MSTLAVCWCLEGAIDYISHPDDSGVSAVEAKSLINNAISDDGGMAIIRFNDRATTNITRIRYVLTRAINLGRQI
jgi:hypothetical protein